MNPLGKSGKPTWKLFGIVIPVAKRFFVRISLSKSSIIQYKQFNSRFCRLFRQLQYLFLPHIKIHGFP